MRSRPNSAETLHENRPHLRGPFRAIAMLSFCRREAASPTQIRMFRAGSEARVRPSHNDPPSQTAAASTWGTVSCPEVRLATGMANRPLSPTSLREPENSNTGLKVRREASSAGCARCPPRLCPTVFLPSAHVALKASSPRICSRPAWGRDISPRAQQGAGPYRPEGPDARASPFG